MLLATEDGVSEATPGDEHESVDPSRRLFDVTATGDSWQADVERALRHSGRWPPRRSWSAPPRRCATPPSTTPSSASQFGRIIGSYQAIKHKLADVHIAIELARPLVYGAALSLEPRDVSAAKAAASEAGLLAARSALQTHGAIGFTQEHDLSLLLLRVQALRSAWGTPEAHRRRVLEAL